MKLKTQNDEYIENKIVQHFESKETEIVHIVGCQ
jgi:hypothetical protein